MRGSTNRRTVCAAGLAAAVAPHDFAQAAAASMPDTPVGRRFAEWLAVYNRGGEPEIRRYMREAFPSDPRAPEFFTYVRAAAGPLDVFAVHELSPTRLSVVLAEREADAFDRIDISVGEAAPHFITVLYPNGEPRPLAAPDFPVLTEGQLIRTLRDKLRRETASGVFSGAVVLTKDWRPILTYAGGYADRTLGAPNTLHTKFAIASMGKMFTSVAVAQLAQAGKIDLSATLAAYLPHYPNKAAAAKLTINALMTHTGGTGDIFGPEFDRQQASLRTLEDYIALFGQRDLDFEPGSRRSYSNFGFILLGAVIQSVTGQTYDDYVHDHIFTPAKMPDSGFHTLGRPVPHLARGYTLEDASLRLTGPSSGTSAGGGYSTVFDLVNFAQALMGYRLLDRRYTSLLTRGQALVAPGKAYAYDFSDRAENGVRFIGHNGGGKGQNGDLRIFPASGYTIAALSNFGPPWQKMAQFVSNRLPA